MTKQTKTEKNYSFKLGTIASENENLWLNLEVEVTPDLKNLLRSVAVCSQEPVKAAFNLGNADDGSQVTQSLQRYKVKKIVYASLKDENRDLLFVKELLDTGKMQIPITDIHKVEEVYNCFRNMIAEIIKVTTKYLSFTTKVDYVLNIKEE